jgi:effector-binding domain-containing protein
MNSQLFQPHTLGTLPPRNRIVMAPMTRCRADAHMKSQLRLRTVAVLAALALGAAGGVAMGTEEAVYAVEKEDGDFQVRRYAPQVVAETVVDGTLEEAGNKAFRPLFNYISGANRSQGKIAMTAPVGQQAEGQKIAMTAPVGQEAVSNRWVVTFMMPTNYTMATLPQPTDENVRLRAIPARRMAAVQYSGTWSRSRYERNLARLREWMKAQGLAAAGDPVWARYNAPFTPWFLRRNEVLVPLASR